MGGTEGQRLGRKSRNRFLERKAPQAVAWKDIDVQGPWKQESSRRRSDGVERAAELENR